MEDSRRAAIVRWRDAWLCQALVIALHVSDEALTDFLPVYNDIVGRMRARGSWVPFPTFSFPVWLGLLVLAVLGLLAATPLVARGKRWMRPISIALALLMIANGLGHLGLSLYWGRFAPGAYTSPLLMASAFWLLWTAWRADADIPC